MNRKWTMVLAAAAVAAWAAPTGAQTVVIQENPARAGDGNQARAREGRESREGGEWGGFSPYSQMAKVVGFSPEQVKKVADLQEEHNKSVKEWQAANADKIKSLQAEMRNAYAAKDPNILQAMSRQYQELYAPLWEASKKLHVDVMAVLTPEQKAKWQEHTTLTSIGFWLMLAKPTDEQMEKVKGFYQELIQDPAIKQEEILKKLYDRAVAEVLTPEQKEAMKKVTYLPTSRSWTATSSQSGGTIIVVPGATSRPAAVIELKGETGEANPK